MCLEIDNLKFGPQLPGANGFIASSLDRIIELGPW